MTRIPDDAALAARSLESNAPAWALAPAAAPADGSFAGLMASLLGADLAGLSPTPGADSLPLPRIADAEVTRDRPAPPPPASPSGVGAAATSGWSGAPSLDATLLTLLLFAAFGLASLTLAPAAARSVAIVSLIERPG